MKKMFCVAVMCLSASAFANGPAAGSFNDKKNGGKDNFNPVASANANINGRLNSNASSALAPVTPVPEADSIAMLLAGAVVVGLVLARRRKK